MALVSQEISNIIHHKKTGSFRSLKTTHPLQVSAFSRCCEAEMEAQQTEGRGKEGIIMKRKDVSYFQRLHKFFGITHIYNFMDQMCINEETLRNQNNDESILKTLFYMRSITKIETSRTCVKMWLKSNEPPSNTSYLIERFNSFGDSYFHNIANSLQKLHGFFMSLQGSQGGSKQDRPSSFQVTRQKVVSEFLASVEGKPYFLKILPDEYLFSNELIGLLGGTAEDFTHECLKYKVLMEDFFTSDNYQMLLERNLLFLDCYAQFLRGNITMDKVLESSDLRFTSYLRAKNQKRIRVLVRGFMPNPYIFCMIVEAVLAEEPIMPKPKTFTQEQKIEFDKLLAKEKEQVYEKIYHPTRNNCSQKGSMRCGYAPKPKRRRRKSECDYDY